jgi:AbiV family abortive infection protein
MTKQVGLKPKDSIDVAHKQLLKIRLACLKNAKSLANAAELVVAGQPHVAYHLLVIALEEIGKSSIAEAKYMSSSDTLELEEEGFGLIDDHIKKIFWGLWGGSLLGKALVKEEIESLKGLAVLLHSNRLAYLYVDFSQPVYPADRVQEGEIETLLGVG